METSTKPIGETITTPTKPKPTHSKRTDKLTNSENTDPNLSSPVGLKLNSSNSPSIAKKSATKNPNPLLKTTIRNRKFVFAKKKKLSVNQETKSSETCDKCKVAIGKSKCLCLAYNSLRASQDDFFKYCSETDEINVDLGVKDPENGIGAAKVETKGENVNADLKRSRDKFLEADLEPGSGVRVKDLVKAFENLTTTAVKFEEGDVGEEKEVSTFCPSQDFYLTSESLGLDLRRSYSLDSSQGSFSSRTLAGGGQRRRNSNESAGTMASRQRRRNQRKATSLKPFMLRTEQRGKVKEEEFMKKLQQMLEEEERLRIPIAQGLPWTTDEPHCLPKPPVKEITRPVDLVLNSDIRAVERSEFDQQVAEKMNLIARYRMERERLQKEAEEEEIRRLRKELVPKAQPMPYFDRPFIPSRSVKQPTIPKEPKFHVPQHKKIKCFASLDDFYARE